MQATETSILISADEQSKAVMYIISAFISSFDKKINSWKDYICSTMSNFHCGSLFRENKYVKCGTCFWSRMAVGCAAASAGPRMDSRRLAQYQH